ncbi:MAG: hypothetical protein C0443_10420 [Comamonadaceae bacterium]|nr:hypothetical protein [Comamonadaceae bacterium]
MPSSKAFALALEPSEPLLNMTVSLHADNKVRRRSFSTRHTCKARPRPAALLVESWSQRESLSQPWELQISTLSTNARVDIHALLGQRVTLLTKLADGSSEHPRSGLITEASAVGADGGFARYRLTVSPWLTLLAFGARSAVWRERSVVQIIDSVFGAYSAHAAWAWSPCASQHLSQSHQTGHLSYTVQYRESDLAFVSRVLAREGLVSQFQLTQCALDVWVLVLLWKRPTLDRLIAL